MHPLTAADSMAAADVAAKARTVASAGGPLLHMPGGYLHGISYADAAVEEPLSSKSGRSYTRCMSAGRRVETGEGGGGQGDRRDRIRYC